MNKFSADIARYKSKGHTGKALWLNPVIWAIAFYRLRNWVNVANPPWLIRIPLVIFCFVPNWFCEAFFSMGISPRASIGEGLYIGHIGGVIISPKAVIGTNCDISHRVTVGGDAMGRDGASFPQIQWMSDLTVGADRMLINLQQRRHDIWTVRVK